MKPFKVSIVTPEKIAFEQEAVSVVLPGTEGYLGIWANHAPLVTGLTSGVVSIREGEDEGTLKYLAVSGGFVEISKNVVSILCDSCDPAGEIDLDRAKSALARARERLESQEGSVDRARAEEALHRAEARLRAAYLKDGSAH